MMFFDTNVLIKARILEAPDHDIARERLSSALQEREPLRISHQVVREHLPVVTRPQSCRSPSLVKKLSRTRAGCSAASRYWRMDPLSPSLCFRCVVRSR